MVLFFKNIYPGNLSLLVGEVWAINYINSLQSSIGLLLSPLTELLWKSPTGSLASPYANVSLVVPEMCEYTVPLVLTLPIHTVVHLLLNSLIFTAVSTVFFL